MLQVLVEWNGTSILCRASEAQLKEPGVVTSEMQPSTDHCSSSAERSLSGIIQLLVDLEAGVPDRSSPIVSSTHPWNKDSSRAFKYILDFLNPSSPLLPPPISPPIYEGRKQSLLNRLCMRGYGNLLQAPFSFSSSV